MDCDHDDSDDHEDGGDDDGHARHTCKSMSLCAPLTMARSVSTAYVVCEPV